MDRGSLSAQNIKAKSLFNNHLQLQMHKCNFFIIRKYTNCNLQFCLNRINHLDGVNSSSPYLGSFNFSGLKNLILPSFNPSIRWLYGCAAEGKQIITVLISVTPFINFLFITACPSQQTHASDLHTQNCSPMCCKA